MNFLALDPAALRLCCAVAETGSFSAAGRRCGLTQSAASRQIQRLEEALGVTLFERTTRSVRPTPAGEFLRAHALRLLGDAALTVQRLGEEFAGAPRTLRVGWSRSIGISHLPGLLHAFEARHSEVRLTLEQNAGAALLAGLEQRALDLAIVSDPARLPRTLERLHAFADEFVLIAPRRLGPASAKARPARELLRAWADERWLLPLGSSGAGGDVRTWLRQHGLRRHSAIELDSFDVIASLVALGLGVSLVPRRTLALFARGRRPLVHPMRPRYRRRIAVLARRELPRPAQVTDFVAAILFRK
ncbi:MAG: LysR family transcriptional regulator [Verrucomicrobia bacterium]|nr:LysR family transcriptional regulator [Verrucomicrobiota bacterium]